MASLRMQRRKAPERVGNGSGGGGGICGALLTARRCQTWPRFTLSLTYPRPWLALPGCNACARAATPARPRRRARPPPARCATGSGKAVPRSSEFIREACGLRRYSPDAAEIPVFSHTQSPCEGRDQSRVLLALCLLHEPQSSAGRGTRRPILRVPRRLLPSEIARLNVPRHLAQVAIATAAATAAAAPSAEAARLREGVAA
eukprot:359242-Chlamydomonas_euryale.AAC.2